MLLSWRKRRSPPIIRIGASLAAAIVAPAGGKDERDDDESGEDEDADVEPFSFVVVFIKFDFINDRCVCGKLRGSGGLISVVV